MLEYAFNMMGIPIKVTADKNVEKDLLTLSLKSPLMNQEKTFKLSHAREEIGKLSEWLNK